MRQARVLQTLAGRTDVPVPQVLLVDPGRPPAVPPYYIYPEATGECWEPLTDESGWLPPPGDVRGRVLRAAEVLASLHAVDAARFENIGIERIELADEVNRWLHAFQRADNDEVYEIGAVCADALHARLPEAMPLTVVHGDFRLGNLIANATSVLAILDWEICSLADPRVDVAWFLMTLSAKTLPSAIRATVPGLPAPSAVLERYESACGSGRPLQDMPWFAALSGYRAAAAMALNVKHNRRSKAPSARIERYSQLLTRYLEAAQGLLA
jgi:aminoglycoside phosphotransferase (APT) family kinase protein